MQTGTPAAAAAATARSGVNTLFASLGLSKPKWLVTVNSPGGEKFSRHAVEGGGRGPPLGLLARLRAKAERRRGLPVKVMVIQEAGLDGFWLHRLLAGSGIGSHVVDPASIAARFCVALSLRYLSALAAIGGQRRMRPMAGRCCGRSWPGPAAGGGSARWFGRRAQKRRTGEGLS